MSSLEKIQHVEEDPIINIQEQIDQKVAFLSALRSNLGEYLGETGKLSKPTNPSDAAKILKRYTTLKEIEGDLNEEINDLKARHPDILTTTDQTSRAANLEERFGNSAANDEKEHVSKPVTYVDIDFNRLKGNGTN